MKAKMTLLALLATCTCAFAQIPEQKPDIPLPEGVTMQTFTFATREEGELKLDVYRDKAFDGKQLPVFLYAYGGSWASGTRKDAPWIVRMAQHGMVGVCIEYRLRCKGKQVPPEPEFGAQYDEAIRAAVEDIYDATRFLLENESVLGIDRNHFVISGGSAGAISVNMAEYWLVNEDAIAAGMPEGFNYAGVVSFAGGIWKYGTEDPVWKNKPCPYMFVHGNKDQLVPYGRVTLASCNYGAFGPDVICEQLRSMEVPYHRYTSMEADHYMAGGPDYTVGENPVAIDYTNQVFDFIDRVVILGEKVGLETTEHVYGQPRTLEWAFKAFFEKLAELQKQQQQ